ncbi:hypothetical protein [Micromonospora sp. NBC_01813]|uniref:hypothetical protein n=1 Tax=Micromonospora sp. NBC_01813 TaxID=2975988 RepID=UPI002DDC11DB|nr:hypothetical protein [Micromonospora sp. NBC_01813]WSA11103.1 hypothetical protein OG958_10215 [Micromonospora sp. NBC_01813]
MERAVIRGNIRTVGGLAAVAVALAVVVSLVPRDEPGLIDPWRPPAGHVLADTVDLGDDRALRLWVKPGGWYVQSLVAGQHEASIGAGGRGDQFTVAEVFEAYVGTVPLPDARTVSVRSTGGVAVHVGVHEGAFIVAGAVAASDERRLLVTPLGPADVVLAAETSVPIAGRAQ